MEEENLIEIESTADTNDCLNCYYFCPDFVRNLEGRCDNEKSPNHNTAVGENLTCKDWRDQDDAFKLKE